MFLITICMRLSDFKFDLPDALIAAQPAARREDSRLLVLDRASQSWEHRTFGELSALLAPPDLLVLNNTRVVPMRLMGAKPTGGQVELLFLREIHEGAWLALARGRNLAEGSQIHVENAVFTLLGRVDDAWRVSTGNALPALFYRAGQLPLPPYILQQRKERGLQAEWPNDRERYQTVFASQEGAAAAPTAGLHFTPELLRVLAEKGIQRTELTLHVGLGTFLPVRGEQVEEHPMHAEAVVLDQPTVDSIEQCRKLGGKVTAVGTTVVRALEGVAAKFGSLKPYRGDVNLFVLPGHTFQTVDQLITNFHLPESTLLMLVAAFAGREFLLDAYREAVREGYRFYSYGDAMFIR